MEKQKDEAKYAIQQTKILLKDYLNKINQLKDSEYSLIAIAKWIVIKEKSIYVELNKLKDGDKIITGLFWCPTRYRNTLEDSLNTIRDTKSINPP